VDALIDPAKRTLTTRAFVGGREALAPQDSPLPARFEFTDEHRIRVAWADGGRRWSFSVDKEPATVQERELPTPGVPPGTSSTPAVVPAVATAGAAAPAPSARRRFVPVLVAEDTRAAYYGLSVTGVAASAEQPSEPPAAAP
jgi:hypothetical protein